MVDLHFYNLRERLALWLAPWLEPTDQLDAAVIEHAARTLAPNMSAYTFPNGTVHVTWRNTG